MSTLNVGPNGFPYFVKDPDAYKDYSVDWTAWLLAGDTIVSHSLIVQPGITRESDSRTGAVVTVWLSGGTVGKTYRVTVRVQTANGITDDRSFDVIVRQQ